MSPARRMSPGEALRHPEHVPAGAVQVARALGRRHDDRDSAVGDEAAVEQMERLGDPARVVMILHRHRRFHLGPGRHLGPFSLAYSDDTKMILARAVEVHVASRRHGLLTFPE